jgi:type IV secretion system protein VirB10
VAFDDTEKPETDGIFDAFDEDTGGEQAPGEKEGAEPVDTIHDSGENPFAREEAGEPDAPEQAEPDEAAAFTTESNGAAALPPPFVPSKRPAQEILENGPHKLNKTLILSIILGVFAVFIIFALFISPLLTAKKKEKTKKPETSPVNFVDYSKLVNRNVPESSFEDLREEEDDEEIMRTLPPIDPAYQYKPPENTVTETRTVSGGGSGTERPDTKGDRLQSKAISGIKGITPTQGTYASGGNPGIPAAEYTPPPANPYAQFGMPPKEDYTAELLSRYSSNVPAFGNGSGYANQNDQSGKTGFYQAGRENAGGGVWLGPATVWQGTIFEAVLTGAINTDLPGEVTALISKNVYSSLDGQYLLIPQNSRLFGTYNSSISYSQSRVQVGWHTLIRPDGYAVNLGNMAATDARGAAGLKGFVNDHPFQYLKALALMSAFTIISGEFDAAAAATENRYVQTLMADSQSITRTLGAKLIDRAMDVQPTITIKAGVKINIVANTTLALPPLKPYQVIMPYHR